MKKTDKNKKKAAPPKLSIPTIVVMAVGGVLIVYMLVQPLIFNKAQSPAAGNNPVAQVSTANDTAKPNPAQTAPAPSAAESATGSVATVVQDKAAALADVPVKTKKDELISDRDPFVPSPVLARAAAAFFPVKPPETQTAVEIQPEITAAPAVTPPPDRFAWKGVVGSYGTQQVVIIQYNTRSYILHQGEPVPGTNYLVAEVTPNMVVLTSPDKQIRLSKKKEAKING
jgi:hypothetical protein